MKEYFTTRVRDDDSTFVTFADDCPDWLHDAVREAHDGEFPNDWRYETCQAIVAMCDAGVTEASEMADSLVDTYNGYLVSWLADDVTRTSYFDENSDGGDRGLFDQIRLRQYYCIEQMASILLSAIADNSDEEQVTE